MPATLRDLRQASSIIRPQERPVADNLHPQVIRVTHVEAERSDLPDRALVIESARNVGSFVQYLQELWASKRLVRVLSNRSLKSTYEMNVVGFAWWILEPLTLALMYYFVFTYIFHRNRPVVSLLAALIPYKWLSGTLVQSMGTVRGNASLLDVYFPRALLPMSDAFVGMAHFGVALLIMPVFMLVYGVWGGLYILWVPVIAAAQLVFILGLAYPLSVWGISYRNLPGVMNNLLRLWFYLSPGIWTLDFIESRPDWVKLLVRLNPLTGLFESYRRALIEGRPPGIELAWTALVGVVLFFGGLRYFSKRETQFGKML